MCVYTYLFFSPFLLFFSSGGDSGKEAKVILVWYSNGNVCTYMFVCTVYVSEEVRIMSNVYLCVY